MSDRYFAISWHQPYVTCVDEDYLRERFPDCPILNDVRAEQELEQYLQDHPDFRSHLRSDRGNSDPMRIDAVEEAHDGDHV